jgi:hypothetical protein
MSAKSIAPLHPDTVRLIEKFSSALHEKLEKAQDKYGYSNGWMDDSWRHECQRHLKEHIEKGDPLDVAAYCAFLWFHGWSTK